MKNILIGLILLTGSIGFIFFVLYPRLVATSQIQTRSPAQNETTVTQNEPETQEPSGNGMEENTMQENSKYVYFSQQALDDASSSRRVLFFYANWCPTCRPVDANLMSSKNTLPKDVTVIRVNYNDTETDQEEKDLAQKYGVTYQHTFVQIDSEGNEVTKWNGGDIPEILKNIQ